MNRRNGRGIVLATVLAVVAVLLVSPLPLQPADAADDGGASSPGPVTTIYDSLTDAQKRGYEALDSAVEARTGTGEMRYLSIADGTAVREAYAFDHPECWWFYDCYSLRIYEGLGVCAGFQYTEAYTESEIAAMDRSISSVLSSLHLNAYDPDHERLRSIHDWICDRVTYTAGAKHCYDAYGAIVQGRAVCEGYAMAFTYICHIYGFPCVLVQGHVYTSATEKHAWNLVFGEGDWYFIDTTWDDDSRYSSGRYFMVGSDTRIHGRVFSTEDHIADTLYGIEPAEDRFVDPDDVESLGILIAAAAGAAVIGLLLYLRVLHSRRHPRSAYVPDEGGERWRRCPECGGRIDRRCRFCPICGRELTDDRKHDGPRRCLSDT